tara:strand:+ start:647 stop:799 length:153 start_codon:yes stop_codon:yes gene_type:complete
MEVPELNSEKGKKSNSAVFLMNNTTLQISIKEQQYKLERDEDAFIKAMQS